MSLWFYSSDDEMDVAFDRYSEEFCHANDVDVLQKSPFLDSGLDHGGVAGVHVHAHVSGLVHELRQDGAAAAFDEGFFPGESNFGIRHIS